MQSEIISRFGQLTAIERRNVASVYRWAEAHQKPGGSTERMVDEVYSDAPEVVSVLNNVYVSRRDTPKDVWRSAELELEKRVAKRRVVFDAIHPTGSVICVEARIEQQLNDGTKRGWPFAAFLYFDEAGRIERDHTYMLPPPDFSCLEHAADALNDTAKR